MAKLQIPGKLIYMEWLCSEAGVRALGWDKSAFSSWAVQDKGVRKNSEAEARVQVMSAITSEKVTSSEAWRKSWSYPSQPGKISRHRVASQARQLQHTEKDTVTAKLWTAAEPWGQSQGSALKQASPQRKWVAFLQLLKFSSAALFGGPRDDEKERFHLQTFLLLFPKQLHT